MVFVFFIAKRTHPFLLSVQQPYNWNLIPILNPGLTKALNVRVAFSCDFVPPQQKKQNKKKVSFSLVLGLASSPAPSRESGMGAALAVRIRPRGAGVWVWTVIVVVILCQAFLPYSPVGRAEASQQALVVKTTALLAKRVLHVLSL